MRYSYVAAVAVAVSALHAATFNVRDFGATGDGVKLETAALNKAIQACAKSGGGTVTVPAGTYVIGTVHLQSNVTLSLDAGATLVGTKDRSQYGTALEGNSWYAAMLLAKGVRNVAITGHGVIDGNRVFDPEGEEKMRGPHALLFYDASDITVRDVSFKDAANYAVVLRACERINIDGITARGGWDGINMHDTRNATISNCRLFTGDDALAGAYWENVTVSNCILNSSCNGIRTGGRNVLISNCLIYGPGEYEHRTSKRRNLISGFQILPHRSQEGARTPNKLVSPGPVYNMVLSNVSIVNARSPVWIAYSSDAPYSAKNLGVGSIVMNNLTVTGSGRTPFYVSAPPENPAKSIVLNNVRLSFKGGGDEVQAWAQGFSEHSVLQSSAIYLRSVEHAELHDVRVSFDDEDRRPVIYGENVGRLELDRFIAPQVTGGAPAMLFAGIRDLLIDGKRARSMAGTTEGVEAGPANVWTGEPFNVLARLTNPTRESALVEARLAVAGEAVTRSAWLEGGQSASIRWMNLRRSEPGEIAAGAKPVTVSPRPAIRPPGAGMKSFSNVDSQITAIDGGFYIRGAGDATIMDLGDQYASVYVAKGLPLKASAVVEVDNPDVRTSWLGRAGLMIRNEIAKPGQSAGYVMLATSPANGPSLEWDSDGDGRIDRHTVLDGYSVWPHWLKLERNGSRVSGSVSSDGHAWKSVGEVDIPSLNGIADAGVFVHRSAARFREFRVVPDVF